MIRLCGLVSKAGITFEFRVLSLITHESRQSSNTVPRRMPGAFSYEKSKFQI